MIFKILNGVELYRKTNQSSVCKIVTSVQDKIKTIKFYIF